MEIKEFIFIFDSLSDEKTDGERLIVNKSTVEFYNISYEKPHRSGLKNKDFLESYTNEFVFCFNDYEIYHRLKDFINDANHVFSGIIAVFNDGYKEAYYAVSSNNSFEFYDEELMIDYYPLNICVDSVFQED